MQFKLLVPLQSLPFILMFIIMGNNSMFIPYIFSFIVAAADIHIKLIICQVLYFQEFPWMLCFYIFPTG
jgi:hypothetical protein